MFETLKKWRGLVADYTVGTVIVMAHMMTADSRAAERRPARLRR